MLRYFLSIAVQRRASPTTLRLYPQLHNYRMGQDPREAWRKLSQMAMDRGSRPNLPGGPRGFFGGAVGLVLLGTSVVFINNALFNGI